MTDRKLSPPSFSAAAQLRGKQVLLGTTTALKLKAEIKQTSTCIMEEREAIIADETPAEEHHVCARPINRGHDPTSPKDSVAL